MLQRAQGIVVLVLAGLLCGAHPGLRAEWVRDGVPICSSSGDQGHAYITPDGRGGVFIAWSEVRSGTPYDFDIYVQRIDKSGAILWNPEGVPICVMPGGQADPSVIQDGAGGVLIAWRDQRDQYFRVYAQRVDGNGNIQWTPNGVSVCTSPYPQYMPLMVPDGQGNYYISWRDDRYGYGQVLCQKLDGSGNLLWRPDGVDVCPTLGWQDWPYIVPDTKGGAIIAWHDERYGPLSHYIYAQRIDRDGNLLWGEEGAPICLFDYYKWSLDCIADGDGGGIVTWHGYGYGGGGGYEVFAQRFDSTGAILWLNSGVPVCQAAGNQIRPHLISDDAGGAIVAWLDNRDGRDDIYGQRVLSDGNVGWQTDGLMIHEGPPSSGFGYSVPDIVGDGTGGAILSWQEGPGSPALWDIRAQRVDGDGNILWPDSAVSVCRAPGGQYYPQMTENGEGGAIITWRDMRNGAKGAVYAMRVTGNGETVATLLQSYSARVAKSSSVILEWVLSEIDPGARFEVFRRQAGANEYESLGGPGIQRNGLSFAYIDESCEPGLKYKYRVNVVNGRERLVLFETEEIALPSLPLALFQNYPNPFNPSTTIGFFLPNRCQVTLEIYDTSGRLIKRLLDRETKPAGPNATEWRGLDGQGRAVGSGVYFCRLRAGKETISKKMTLLK